MILTGPSALENAISLVNNGYYVKTEVRYGVGAETGISQFEGGKEIKHKLWGYVVGIKVYYQASSNGVAQGEGGDFVPQSPNGVTILEDGINKSIIKLDHNATIDFYDYLEMRKNTGDLIVALSPTPAGAVGKAFSIGTKILAIGDYFFGEQPGFDTYIRYGKEQGITLTSYTSYNAMGSSTTFQIILNSDKSVLGYKTIMNF